MSSKHVIGLFGFGVVGEVFYKMLPQFEALQTRIKHVCIKHDNKKRNAPASLFTTDHNQLLQDDEIDIIVEAIDDAEAAWDIVSTALRNGKHVVTANKKMVAEHLPQLLELQRSGGCSLLYEAAVGASIPIIRNLEEYYNEDLLSCLEAIINGTTNFILTLMDKTKCNLQSALKEAQFQGFAESDSTSDIDGYDAAYKASILLWHAYGIRCRPFDLLFSGIGAIKEKDLVFARSLNAKVKLMMHAFVLNDTDVAVFVLPQFVQSKHPLSEIVLESNAVNVERNFADRQLFAGKGAGSFPTASALWSDVAAICKGYRYRYNKLNRSRTSRLAEDFYLHVYVSYNAGSKVPLEHFEWIDEWYIERDRSCIIGGVHVRNLKNKDWWRRQGVSLIVMPTGIKPADGMTQGVVLSKGFVQH